MQNTFNSSAFLPVVLSNQTTILKNDHNPFLISETNATKFSQLYRLLFGNTVAPVKQTEEQQALSDPDEYSSYE